MSIRKLIGVTVAAVMLGGMAAFAADDLERGFLNPPDSAKPHTYWWWMNANVSREGITADLEAFKRVGLGGVVILEATFDTPPGPAKFQGDLWWQLMHHTVAEADRLGLDVNVTQCAGWSSSGGPWITPEQGMQMVVTSELGVQGPAHISTVLPRPKVNRDYYRDIAVLAFRTPRGEVDHMNEFAPKITASTPDFDGPKILDGNPETRVPLPLPPEPQRPYVQVEFSKPYPARTLTLAGIIPQETPFELQVSADGRTFRTIHQFLASGWKTEWHLGLGPGVEPVTSRFYRVVFPRFPGIQLAEVNLSDRLCVENFDSKAAYLRWLGGFYASPENRGVRADTVADSAGQTAPGYVVPRQEMVDLTGRLAADGRLEWDVPDGQWTLLRVGHTVSDSHNKGVPGGIGLECDKLSKAAAEAHWAGMMQKVVDDAGPLAGKALVATHIDSWEVGSQNWTAAFPGEFRRRRGYDLRPFLPVFSNRIVDSPEITERFLWDVRRTIAELFADNYYGAISTLARRCGLKLQAQTYGSGPMDEVLSSGQVDIPMGEFWDRTYEGNGEPSIKTAASAGHTYGRKVISAEAYSRINSKWDVYPFALKPIGDISYCKGINRFDFNSPAAQPWLNMAPGMTPGAWGIQYDRNITWWNQSAAWIRYLTRCQFLLQEGRFAADVCFLAGEDYLAGIQQGAETLTIDVKPSLPAGYDYDFIDRRNLLENMKVENGVFVLPSGMRYRFLVLPDSKALSLVVVRKVRELVGAGGTVIGRKPIYSPTLENYPACETEIRKIADEVWGPCDGKTVTENRYGQGRIIWGQSYAEVFASAGLPLDFTYACALPNVQLSQIHRTSPAADWYFVASMERNPIEAVCSFRISGKRPEFWHPDTGKIEPAAWYRIENGQTFVPMHFDPYGSVFVVFRDKVGDGIVSVARDGKPVIYDRKSALMDSAEFQLVAAKESITLTAFVPGRYEFTTAAGKKAEAMVELPQAVAVEGPWNISFEPKWFYPDGGMNGKVRFNQLADWAKRPEDAVKYFSGTAVYRKDFDVPVGSTSAGRRLWLDLGRVEVIAEVEVNGKDLGVLWKPPFSVDITGAVKPGEKNTLVVKVTNLWPNRLIGDEHLPVDCDYASDGHLTTSPEWLTKNTPRTSGRRTFATWRHWKAEDPLLPSGLLGPVRLAPASVTTLPVK